MTTLDTVSLLLLQPDDQIREQCKIMDPLTLARFSQTNKRIHDICADILAVHKYRYEKEKPELLEFFTVSKHKFFTFDKDVYGQVVIAQGFYPPNSIEITLIPNDVIFRNFLSKIPNVNMLGTISNLSDKLKLDILKMAKKLGYTNIYMFDGPIRNYKSLNEFSII